MKPFKIIAFLLLAMCPALSAGMESLSRLGPDLLAKGRYDEVGLRFNIGEELVLMEESKWVLLQGIPIKVQSSPVKSGNDWLLPFDLVQMLRKRGLINDVEITRVSRGVRPIVVIDPGHGGKDPGAIGMGGTMEKDIVLDVGKRVATLLRRHPIELQMTRTTDDFVDLHKRCEMSNEWRATTFVSLHCNGNDSRKLKGYQLYRQSEKVSIYSRAEFVKDKFPLSRFKPVLPPSKDRQFSSHVDLFRWKDKESVKLSGHLHRSLSYRNSQATTQPSQNLCVLRETMAPSILVEMDFVSNPEVEVQMGMSSWRQRMAEDIVDGILDYLGIKPQS
jgi:N-acetylmuramoyl-L-alanine amidase